MITKKKILGYFLMGQIFPAIGMFANFMGGGHHPYIEAYIVGLFMDLIAIALFGFIFLAITLMTSDD